METADTALTDPYGPSDNPFFSGDTSVQHAFDWRNGAITDLGALGPQPDNNSSMSTSVNARGDVSGVSDNGTIDPLLGHEEADAVLEGRADHQPGTLGGNESVAFSLNNNDRRRGSEHDPRPRLDVRLRNPDACVCLAERHDARFGHPGRPRRSRVLHNDAGQAAGNRTRTRPSTQSPAVRPPTRSSGKTGTCRTSERSAEQPRRSASGMRSTITGRSSGRATWPVTRPPTRSYGTDGRSSTLARSEGTSEPRAGSTTPAKSSAGPPPRRPGLRSVPVEQRRAYNLGTVPGDRCSVAQSINNLGQVVGNAGDRHGSVDAFLSEHGSTINLNSLIAPSALHLQQATAINNRGEIIGLGVLPNGKQRAYVLIPHTEPAR